MDPADRHELREKLARTLSEHGGAASWEHALNLAHVVLNMEEIDEALDISACHTGDFRDYLLRRGRWAGVSKDAGYV
jgi:hypothetical protein